MYPLSGSYKGDLINKKTPNTFRAVQHISPLEGYLSAFMGCMHTMFAHRSRLNRSQFITLVFSWYQWVYSHVCTNPPHLLFVESNDTARIWVSTGRPVLRLPWPVYIASNRQFIFWCNKTLEFTVTWRSLGWSHAAALSSWFFLTTPRWLGLRVYPASPRLWVQIPTCQNVANDL